jgi:predicted phosphodiesterase
MPTKKKTQTISRVIPPKPNNHTVICLPDLHIPYHDQEALDVVLHSIEIIRPERVVILGDWLDAAAMSSHPAKSLQEMRSQDFYESEIAPCNKVLDKIQKYSKHLIYIEGNHEARCEKTAAQMGGAFAAVYNLVSPRTLLGSGRSNFTWIPYNSKLAHYEIAKDLWALHGLSHSTHAAYAHLNALKSISCIYGHTHRQDVATTRHPVTGKVIRAWSPGKLCLDQPLWQLNNPTGWVTGFDILYVKDDLSEWQNYTLTIQNGETILPGGRTVKA